MVKLNRIYTKTGDDGTTGLGDGKRVSKTDIRVVAYGTVDEANAALGVCIVHAGAASLSGIDRAAAIASLLTGIQNDMFDLGADLCCPITVEERTESGLKPGDRKSVRLRVTPGQTARLERAIDEHNERLSPLNSFVLPGGSAFAAALHVARTVVRRAERDSVQLLREQPGQTNPETVHYLNRLSDLLFVLARIANDDGAADVKWIPGANRTH